MTNNSAVAATTPAGLPVSSADAVQATAATAPTMDTPMPLTIDSGNSQQRRDTCNEDTCRAAGQ
eukprot:946692-Pyramimonas_sp.AAC.2